MTGPSETVGGDLTRSAQDVADWLAEQGYEDFAISVQALIDAQPVAQEPLAWLAEWSYQGRAYRRIYEQEPNKGAFTDAIVGWTVTPLTRPATPEQGAGRDWYSDCRVLMANLDALIEITGEAPEDDDGFMVDEIREAVVLRAQSAPVGGERINWRDDPDAIVEDDGPDPRSGGAS